MSDDAIDRRQSAAGLLTKGLLLATQRWVDIAMLCYRFSYQGIFEIQFWSLLGSIIVSTFILAYTMANHRSAFRSAPHGLSGVVSSILQLAAVWEMLDKMFATASTFDVEQGPARLPKGSRGENLMRGLRKLSIVCMLHLLVSVVVNASWFYQVFQTEQPAEYVLMVLPLVSMIMGLTCLAMACADMSLYVWVDDFFVKENKKLVSVHYGIEVWNRIPTLVVFHQIFSYRHYWPTCMYLSVDLLLLTLLQFASFYTRLSSQKNYGLMVRRLLRTAGWSIPLLIVNFHYFDPGLSFAYINRGYYIIRVVETAVFLSCIYCTSWFDIPDTAQATRSYVVLSIYLYTTLASTVLMVLMVWVVIPYRRKKLFGPSEEVWPPTEDVDLPEYSDWSYRNLVTTYSDQPLLDRCGDVLEMLWVLSRIQSPRVRSQILNEVVTSLRLVALPWEGEYVASYPRQRIKVESADKLITAFITHEDTETCSIHHGVLESATSCFLLRQDQQIVLSGSFDGAEIWWSDNSKWVRTGQGEVQGLRAVLPLLLPQLVWALRWEEPIAGDSVDVDKNPLLWFLIMYGILLQDASFCTSLYWHMYALGDPSADEDPNVGESYTRKRLAFVRTLISDENVGGRRQTPGPETVGFRKKVVMMLVKQRNMWKQKVRLLDAARGPRHAYHERTRRVKALLRRIMRKDEVGDDSARVPMRYSASEDSAPVPREILRSRRASVEIRARIAMQEDYLLEHVDNDPSMWASPLDPEIELSAEDVEVVKSANAPIVVSMRSQATLNLAASSADRLSQDEDEPLVRYMIKNGDDLRQDALILQFMALFEKVWHERLSSDMVEWLQLAPYQVLAVTPYAGYVKFVPNSYSLSQVLRQSGCSSIVRWLRDQHPPEIPLSDVLDRLCGSVAAYTVATYVLGVGDRHLDNLMLTTEGRFFHVDFGFILGDDPKPFAPRLRLPREVVEALQFAGAPSRRIPPGSPNSACGSRLPIFLDLCQQAFIALRQTSCLWTMLLKLTAAAGGAGVKKLKSKSGRTAALARLKERLHLHVNVTDEVAAKEFAKILVTESEAMYPTLLDKLHNVVQIWH